ncbi:phosphotransferase family protein [Actinopolymorpha singaporensis]|uniref:5-methylthioribose kinase n=1 Tax=Actinopolymorpha singaporensis TaxID=117157 RepID=A0A1H1LYA4_9ACTN|nr:aminoglycoside phosphotransferase family protein [Actinopolymorpha singaporensis]SDR79503.1 5-methylthioribose kinase [Actinopolymorpha singaporensis]
MRLSEDTVVRHLRDRGVLAPDSPATASVLSGGVSGATFLVVAEGGPVVRTYVVKQPLPFLAVADEWPARVERAGVEAAALRWYGELTPAHLPRLVDYDPGGYVVTMTAAPSRWTEWRKALLAGVVDVAAGTTLGRVLGTWHAATARPGARERLAAYGDLTMFVELRGDPYHRTVAARRPDLAAPVLGCLDELLTRPRCLVHGDFSPKNVLVDPAGAAGGLWVLDHEVAHAGNPVFDVAFMLHHLVMKGVHLADRPDGLEVVARLARCAEAFRTAYAQAGGLAVDEEAVVRHTGALLLARVHGKSPAAYLTGEGAAAVSALGARAVVGGLGGVADLFPRAPVGEDAART